MKKALLVVAVAMAVFSAGSEAAWAATVVQRTGAFAEVGPDGTLKRQNRMAVNHATGDVYVANTVRDEIVVYRPAGTGATEVAAFGSGQVTDPFGLAIDQDSGDVFVSDSDDIVKYDGDNTTTPAFSLDGGFTSPGVTGPLAFDQGNDRLLVADTAANTIRRYTAAGTTDGSFDGSAGAGSPGAFAGLQDLAVDSNGDVVVVDSTGNPATGTGTSRVERFAANGDWEATIGPVADAATVGVIPESNEVLVSGNQDSVDTNDKPTVQRYSATGTDLGPVAIDGSVIYSTISGIAADDGADPAVYVGTDVSAGTGTWAGQYGRTTVQAYVVGESATVTIAPATDVAGGSATLHGTVNPEGAATSYHFEYSTDGSSWTSTATENAGDGSTAVAVEADIDGLDPIAAYTYRLVAARGAITSTSAEEQFTTTAAAPTVVTKPAPVVRHDRAVIGGTVDPGGQATRYWVEYGKTTAYGSTSPGSKDADAGDGVQPLVRNRLLVGLEPSTTYHYRLVAANDAGTVEGEDRTVTTDAAPSEDSGRRYEQVSPADRNGYDVVADVGRSAQLVAPTAIAAAARDGSAVVWPSFGAGPDTTSGNFQTYRTLRTSSGWKSQVVSPPTTIHANALGATGRAVWLAATPDLSNGLAITDNAWDPQDTNYGGAADAFDLALPMDVYKLDPDGAPSLESRTDEGAAGGRAAGGINSIPGAALSRDGQHTVFTAAGHYVAEDASRPDDLASVYERAGGQTRLVSLLPDGSQITDNGGASLAYGIHNLGRSISSDASKVLFTSRFNPSRIYMRIDGERTVEVNRSRRTDGPVSDPVSELFVSASEDLSRVYFTSPRKLIDGIGGGECCSPMLYEYRPADDSLRLALPRLDGVQVLDVTRDGRKVFFISRGPEASDVGTFVLERSVESGTIERISPHTPAGNEFSAPAMPSGRLGGSTTSADGSTWLFASTTDFVDYGPTPQPPPPGNDGDAKQVYLYRDGKLSCLSCPPAIRPLVGRSWVASGDGGIAGAGDPGVNASSLSGDGSRAAFTTVQPLVAGDTNGTRDVYEWHDNKLTLVSTGRSAQNSDLLGMSEDGKDVFFLTPDALDPRDADGGSIDLYDARIGGGFPGGSGQATLECSGDECQGPRGAPPVTEGAGSQSPGGAGDPPAKRRRSEARVSVTRPKAVRGSAVTLRVRVPGAGRLSVSGSRVQGVSRSVAKGTTVRLRVRLSAKARARLAKRRGLRVKVKVAFTPKSAATFGSSSNTVTVSFKRPKATKGGR